MMIVIQEPWDEQRLARFIRALYYYNSLSDTQGKEDDMAGIMETIGRATNNVGIASFCLSQLPERMRPLFEVKVENDAYFLKSIAAFIRRSDKKVFQVELISIKSDLPEIDGLPIKVPEEFIAMLCVAT
jgi:hypothetical protein